MEGFRFYENLDEGLGSYFLDCLFSDIDSLLQFFGIHPIVFDYHQSRHAGFPEFAIDRSYQVRVLSSSEIDARSQQSRSFVES